MRWGKSKDEVEQPSGDSWYVVGAPLAGTETAVEAIDRGTAGGVASLAAVDPAFDADAFVEWSKTVYARAVAAWETRSPEPLRPVMEATVWNSYAQHLLMVSTVPLVASLMGSARGTPRLLGASTDEGHQSAVIGFDVEPDRAVFAKWNLTEDRRSWSELWLFQRPESCQTHASGAVAVCPVCGAPAQPEETGKCRYCHADISTRTAGWLVTRTATTMAGMARMDDRLAQIRARSSAAMASIPPPVGGSPLQPPRAAPPLQPPRAGV